MSKVTGRMLLITGDGFYNMPDDTGLWFDRYLLFNTEWGLKLSWVKGISYRPVSKLYHWLLFKKPPNPWNSGDYWYISGPESVERPFISFKCPYFKFYIGWKTYELDEKDNSWNCNRMPFGQYLSFSMRTSDD